LFGESKAKLADMRRAVEASLERLRLLVHQRKSRVYRCADGVTFLGWRLFPQKSRLVRENVVRFRRRLRQMERAFREGAATREEIRARIHSWIGHAAAGDTWRLREHLFAQFTLVEGECCLK
jgi:50S ribosomal subunit-associated GTPase HflX